MLDNMEIVSVANIFGQTSQDFNGNQLVHYLNFKKERIMGTSYYIIRK